jgi:hypothetical protein
MQHNITQPNEIISEYIIILHFNSHQLSADSFHTLTCKTVESLKTFYSLTGVSLLFYGITSLSVEWSLQRRLIVNNCFQTQMPINESYTASVYCSVCE